MKKTCIPGNLYNYTRDWTSLEKSSRQENKKELSQQWESSFAVFRAGQNAEAHVFREKLPDRP
jgi:hypothetical protein